MLSCCVFRRTPGLPFTSLIAPQSSLLILFFNIHQNFKLPKHLFLGLPFSSTYTHFLGDLIQSHHLYSNNSQSHISNPHLTTCLCNYSLWMPNRHLIFTLPKIKSLIFTLTTPQNICSACGFLSQITVVLPYCSSQKLEATLTPLLYL